MSAPEAASPPRRSVEELESAVIRFAGDVVQLDKVGRPFGVAEVYHRIEFRLGERDVVLGELEGTPFYIGGQQYEAWEHTQLLSE